MTDEKEAVLTIRIEQLKELYQLMTKTRSENNSNGWSLPEGTAQAATLEVFVEHNLARLPENSELRQRCESRYAAIQNKYTAIRRYMTQMQEQVA